MFKLINKLQSGIPVKIAGLGHARISDAPDQYRLVSQPDYIQEYMSILARKELFGHSSPFSQKEINSKVEDWIERTGIDNRLFFSGNVAELGLIAAQNCLKNANVNPHKLDIIIGVSNTGTGYPSLADHIKGDLFNLVDKITGGPKTMCFDMTEACTAGTIATSVAWSHVRSSLAKNVLIVWSEKATELAPYDDWKSANLFGDGASAMLLTKSQNKKESFLFWNINSFPYEGGLGAILKTFQGFTQQGQKVHKFVGRIVVKMVVDAIKKANIVTATIDFFIPHQPSLKTLELLEKNIRKNLPDFGGKFCIDVVNTGNISSASTGRIMSKLIESGELRRGHKVVTFSFGAGLSVAITSFVY